jgi:Low affinity iron permease
MNGDDKVWTEKDIEIAERWLLTVGNQMFKDREHVVPVLVHLRSLWSMAAVLDLKLVDLKSAREFIQVRRISVWHIELQNRDARASHLKLDEIIKSIDPAHNEMIDIEHLSDNGLQKLADKYQKVREEYRQSQSPAQTKGLKRFRYK